MKRRTSRRSDQCTFRPLCTPHRRGGGALCSLKNCCALFRYKHVDYYEPELFGRTYDWMKSWDLRQARAACRTVVDPLATRSARSDCEGWILYPHASKSLEHGIR